MAERYVKAAQDFARRRQYHRGVPLRRAFLSVEVGPTPTSLERLLNSTKSGVGGGRGGRTRLALLLTLMWVNSAGDHSSTRPARWWGQMIGISDPQRAARVASANMKALADRGFITIADPAPGMPPTVTLLNELGSPGPYQRPDGKDHMSYFRIPETLWTAGAIGDLSGPGLAMYLILLYYYRTDSPGTWLSPSYFHERHGLSEGTRLNGITDLYTHGLITVQNRIIDNAGTTASRTFPRRVLTLDRRFAPPPRGTDPDIGGGDPFADPPSEFIQADDGLLHL